MKLRDRIKAASAAFRAKSTSDTMTLNQLLDFLGVHNTSGATLSNATYFACLKVLSESIGKLPLKVQQYTPARGIRVAREHHYYRMLNERPNRYMPASTFWATELPYWAIKTAMLPTPRASDYKVAVKLYPSRVCNPNKDRLPERIARISQMTTPMAAGNGGQMNPQWVEWLMGFPIGWTDLNA